jgi:hypothetical protein
MNGLVKAAMLNLVIVVLCIKPALAHHELILVVSRSSTLQEVSSLDLRKLYLGFSVSHDGISLKGLRNTSDEGIERIFYQNVVAMSKRAYERRMRIIALGKGTPRTAAFDDTDRLVEALNHDPYSVSYMWNETAELYPSLKTLRIIWESQ